MFHRQIVLLLAQKRRLESLESTKLVTPLGIPSILQIGCPVLVSKRKTVLSVNEASKNLQQLESLATLGQALLRMTTKISQKTKSMTSMFQLVVMTAQLSLQPKATSFTLYLIYIEPRRCFWGRDLDSLCPDIIYFMHNSLPDLEQLDDETLMEYLQNFLDIADFKKVDNGKELLAAFRENPDHPKIKSITRKVLALFSTDSPGAKVCTLQFLKQAMQTNNWSVIEAVQKTLLPQVVQVIEYRPHIRSIQRGSSYFMPTFDKEVTDEEISNLIKLSSTYFRMIHECVYVWGAYYFPNSSFDRMRIRLMKRFDFPKYPEDFKFFTDKKIENFKLNCQDVIKRMVQYNEEVISKSSIQKKRQTSVKYNKTQSNMINKHSRSQSTQQLSQMNSTKKKEKELNLKNALQKEKVLEKQKHKQKKNGSPEKKQVESSLTNSSLLRKKNSFNEAPIDPQHQQELKSHSEKQSSQSLKPKSKQEANKQPRFRTISEHQDSQGGRYSIKQSVEQTSEQFSETNYVYEDRANQSPRSMLSVKKQKDNAKIPLKKYISQQITHEIAKKPTSLHETKGNQKNRQVERKEEKQVNQKDGQKSKKTVQKDNRDNKQSAQVQAKQQKYNLPPKDSTKNQSKKQNFQQDNAKNKNVPNLPLPTEQKGQDQKRKRRDETSRKKKFVSSQQENTHKEPQTEINPLEPQLSQNQKNQPGRSNNDQNISKKEEQVLIDKARQPEQTKEVKNQASRNEPAVIPKPMKMVKPQKIKGNSSGKTVFEGKEYNIVETIAQPKSVEKAAQNNQPINNKANQHKKQPSLGKDIYQMVEDMQTQDLVTIQLKKQAPISKPQKIVVQEQVNLSKNNNSLKQQQTIVKKNRQQSPIVQIVSQQNKRNQLKPTKQVLSSKEKQALPMKQEYILAQKQKSGGNGKEKQALASKSDLKINSIVEISQQMAEQPCQDTKIQTNTQEKGKKLVSKAAPLRLYSPKNLQMNNIRGRQFQTPLYSNRQTLRQTQQTQFIQTTYVRQKSYSRRKLQKQQQICMAIYPQEQSVSELQPKSRVSSINEVKDLLKTQLSEEFCQLRNTLQKQQQENIQQSIEDYASKLKSQIKSVEAVDFGIQTKIRQKQKVRAISKRKYKMFDQEPNQQPNLNAENISAGKSINILNNKANQTTNKHVITEDGNDLKLRANSKSKNTSNGAEYEPNTLLYVLFHKRSLVQSTK